MKQATHPSIQIRMNQKTPEAIKNWFKNQNNANDAAKRALEHFIRIYGAMDIDAHEIQLKMAKDLIAASGAGIPVIPARREEQTALKEQPAPMATVVKKVRPRGEINI